jgi:DNA-binding transcriptional MerR regulator
MSKRAGAIASRLGVHADTIRDWSDDFAEFFSSGAQKGANLRREFDLNDEIVLNTINELRKQGIALEEIRARLRNGERIETLPALNEPVAPESAMVIYQKITRLEIQLETALDEVERLREQLANKSENEVTLRSKIAVLEYQIEQLKKDRSE